MAAGFGLSTRRVPAIPVCRAPRTRTGDRRGGVAGDKLIFKPGYDRFAIQVHLPLVWLQRIVRINPDAR